MFEKVTKGERSVSSISGILIFWTDMLGVRAIGVICIWMSASSKGKPGLCAVFESIDTGRQPRDALSMASSLGNDSDRNDIITTVIVTSAFPVV